MSETTGKAPEAEADIELCSVAVYSIQIGDVKLSFRGVSVAFALLGLDYFSHDWISIIFTSGSRKYTNVRIPTFSIFFSVTSPNNSAPLLKAMFKVVSTFSTSNAIAYVTFLL